MGAKEENAVSGPTEDKVSEFAIKDAKNLAILVQEEAAQDIIEQHTKPENVLTKKVRSQSNERASQSSQAVGYVDNEESPEFFDDKFNVKTNNANLKIAATKAKER